MECLNVNVTALIIFFLNLKIKKTITNTRRPNTPSDEWKKTRECGTQSILSKGPLSFPNNLRKLLWRVHHWGQKKDDSICSNYCIQQYTVLTINSVHIISPRSSLSIPTPIGSSVPPIRHMSSSTRSAPSLMLDGKHLGSEHQSNKSAFLYGGFSWSVVTFH